MQLGANCLFVLFKEQKLEEKSKTDQVGSAWKR